MAIIENLSTLESSNAALSVTLHQNHLKKDGSYFARVSRNTATFNNVISEIAEENKGLDPHLLQYSAILIQKKILKMLEQGKAVNILDLGTMYIAMKCSAKGKNDVSNNGKFCIVCSCVNNYFFVAKSQRKTCNEFAVFLACFYLFPKDFCRVCQVSVPNFGSFCPYCIDFDLVLAVYTRFDIKGR